MQTCLGSSCWNPVTVPYNPIQHSPVDSLLEQQTFQLVHIFSTVCLVSATNSPRLLPSGNQVDNEINFTFKSCFREEGHQLPTRGMLTNHLRYAESAAVSEWRFRMSPKRHHLLKTTVEIRPKDCPEFVPHGAFSCIPGEMPSDM